MVEADERIETLAGIGIGELLDVAEEFGGHEGRYLLRSTDVPLLE